MLTRDRKLSTGAHERAFAAFSGYFSADATLSTRFFYSFLATVVAVYSVVAVFAPLIRPECVPPERRHLGQGNTGGLEDEPNPSYTHDPCRWVRYWVLLGLNPWEADM